MIGDYTEQQHADMLHRDRAQAMREALSLYQADMRRAVRASLFHGDENSADGFRADARAALHEFPALLAMVEPLTEAVTVCKPCAEYRAGERQNGEAFGVPVHVCERVDGMAPMAICPCGCPVEPGEPEGVEAVTALVERVGEWTGR